jgi:hypothetical protein
MSDEKECFFIAPIGEEGSEHRERSNKLMEYIVEEAVSDYGYSVIRADQMDEPGSITNQIIEKAVNSELVVADLTGHNPNVFYELAVRHATGEPYIQLINSSESIPFDISDLRTIEYTLDVKKADQARKEIRSQLESLRNEDSEFDNPISRSAEMQSLRESENPTDQNLGEILQTLSILNRKVEELESNRSTPNFGSAPGAVQAGRQYLQFDDRVYDIREKSMSRERLEAIADDEDIPVEEVEAEVLKNGIKIVD